MINKPRVALHTTRMFGIAAYCLLFASLIWAHDAWAVDQNIEEGANFILIFIESLMNAVLDPLKNFITSIYDHIFG